MSTVTVVSNWSFRSFRNRLNQQDYVHHPNYPPNHAPQTPAVGYYRDHDQHQTYDRQDRPLMLENSGMDFVTDRTPAREKLLRTPSPSKQNRRFA